MFMDRRNFIRLGFAGAVTGIIAPKLVLAGSSDMAGGLYYTKDAPGRWSKKAGGHLPNIEVSKGSDGVSLHIVTSHEMKGYEHYIIKHVVLDKDFKFIAENMFDPTKDKAAISDIAIGSYQGPVNVLSVCNKHDTWLNVAEV
jgi:superoxide reductase